MLATEHLESSAMGSYTIENDFHLIHKDIGRMKVIAEKRSCNIATQGLGIFFLFTKKTKWTPSRRLNCPTQSFSILYDDRTTAVILQDMDWQANVCVCGGGGGGGGRGNQGCQLLSYRTVSKNNGDRGTHWAEI